MPLEEKAVAGSTGPLQVMDAAMDYRKKHSYKGQIHTAVGYYGWFPEVAAFDDAYSQEIKTAETCLEYEKEQTNIPTILWNAFTCKFDAECC